MLNSSNTNSLIFYTALLEDTESSLTDIMNNPDLPGRDSLINQYTELIKSHKNNITRLEKQIENPAEALTELQAVLDFLIEMYEVLKHWIPEQARAWIELLIKAAKKLIEKFK